MSNKITFEHLNKNVYIYIRQSSPGQVKTNTASQEVQRNLKNRALLLGWKESQIKILDEDLGTCASLSGIRSDFQSLIQKISKAQTGALFFLEASRLARNGKEWCHALEVCTIFNVLIIDRGAVYDPALPGDRMNLGMQGVFSEYEVNQLRLRAREAIELKASKGELIIGYPPAYIKTEDGRLEKTPDERIREAIDGVFTRFDKLGSVNQVFNWYFDNNIELPVRDNANGHKTLWRIPSYKTPELICIPKPKRASVLKMEKLLRHPGIV
jgi:DNA invertase Pin-like site-specific DNA recombinase